MRVAVKRLEFRQATREFHNALCHMTLLVGRFLETNIEPSAELEQAFERASGQLIDLSNTVCDIAELLKVRR